MIDIPDRFADLVDRRTLPFLEALPLGDYDLRMLLRSAYSQGLTDAMQLAGNRPNTFDGIVLGRMDTPESEAKK